MSRVIDKEFFTPYTCAAMIEFLLKLIPTKIVYAHCDIPCGIYDPHGAQLASHTVIRMTNLISETKMESDAIEHRQKFVHQMSRLTRVKEQHAELVKHEIRVLWADYFKPEHLKENPGLHELVFETLKLASKARQEINIDAANQLLVNVQKIAEIFWKTKGVESARIKAPYPSGGEIIVPKA